MKDLFDFRRRDSHGRFADEKTARYEKALKEAAQYKRMYESLSSQLRGMSKIIRMKDEIILKLKQ